MEQACIKIDIERLAIGVSGPDSPTASSYAHLWLVARGFTYHGNVWCCDSESLGELKPDEIIELIETETIDGVTFVKHERENPPLQP